MKLAAKFQEISEFREVPEYLNIIRDHLITIMMDDSKETFRIEAIKLVHLGTNKDENDHKGLKLFVMKSLDKSSKVRRAVFRRLYPNSSAPNFEFKYFHESDRIDLILNGLKDPDTQNRELCKQYLAS